MYCPNCGFQNPEETNSCLGCGESLTASTVQPEQPSVAEPAVPAETPVPVVPVQPAAPVPQPAQQQVPPQGQPYQTGYQPPQYNQYTPYNQTPQYQQAENSEGKGLAITSLVLGIVSLMTLCFLYISIPAAIVGLVLGIIGSRKAKNSKGMAIAGIVMSAVSLAAMIIIIVFFGSLFAILGDEWNYYYEYARISISNVAAMIRF